MKAKILSLILVVIMAFAVTSCAMLDGAPAPTLGNLEGYYLKYCTVSGFSATYENAKSELEPGIVQYLVVTENKNKYIKGMATVTIIEYKDKGYAKLAYKQLKLEHKQEIENTKFAIEQSKHLIENYPDKVGATAETDLVNLEKHLDILEDSIDVGIKGNFVWKGHAPLIEKLTKN